MTAKTRYLADDLHLPADWQAERYSTTIRLIGPNGRKADVVLPYDSKEIDQLRADCAEAIKNAK